MEERYIREIISGFPYPIGSYFIRLRTDECIDPGPLRLKYILATGEAIARFLGVVVLCECRDFAEANGEAPPPAFAAELEKSFYRPSWGAWAGYAREGLKWLHAAGAALTMPEIIEFSFKKIPAESAAVTALGKLLTIRNHLSHDKIKAMHAGDFKKICGEAFPLLEEALEALDFLLEYELTFVSRIEVNKKRKRLPTFIHRFSVLMGSSDAFPADPKPFESFLDVSSILLINQQTRSHLNLDPLLVYETLAGKAPDIFFYNGMKKRDTAEYSACHHGGSFVSSESERAEDLSEELETLRRLFSGKQSAKEAANG